MRVVYTRCAGLDVHKKTVVSCRIMPDEQGGYRKEIRTFGTTTADLLTLRDWLAAVGITHVAMESTGVYWKPVFNVLEADFEVLLVNAKHIKFVPGRKTDVKDAQWIGELLQHGLLKASFIPEAPQRELREMIRYRTHLIQERSREVNRIHKVLEDANIKLSSVATNVLGVSGREMLAALIAGQDDPEALAQLAKGKLRNKIAELEQALRGHVKESHRLLLTLHLEHVDDLNEKLERLEAIIDEILVPFDEDNLLMRLDTIPGVDRKTAQVIIAELDTLPPGLVLCLANKRVLDVIIQPKRTKQIATSNLPSSKQQTRQVAPPIIICPPNIVGLLPGGVKSVLQSPSLIRS